MNLSEIRKRIKSCERVCVFTGAGVSAESGIPTFRDAGGLWENYRAEDLVTPEAFARDPVLVWRWHVWLQGLSFNTKPNPAHIAIAEMDRTFPEFLLITQNIDDLHERAGTKRMVKLHGDIMQMSCLDCLRVIQLTEPLDASSFTSRDSLPKCPECGSACRPNVVWFGELLPIEPPEIGRRFSETCDLFLIVGTSGVVSGGYGFTQLARMAGAFIIEVNPEESALSYLADATIRKPAGEALADLFGGPQGLGID
jgi:NAD-dependent deacetylase